jgi:hypothetical protein
MSQDRRINRVTGFLLLLLVVLTVGGFATGATLGELDPFARGDVERLLRAINGNFAIWGVSLVAYIATDLLAVAAATFLYVIFRDRSRPLALLGSLTLVAAAVAFMIHEVGAMTLAFLADDYLVSGGPGTIGVGDPAILEVARAVSVTQAMTALFGQTLMGISVLSFGGLIVWSPAGLRNPPRWIGVAGAVGGVLMLTTWTFLLSHLVGGGATMLAELAVVAMLVGLSIWLLRNPVPAVSPGREGLAPATGAQG